MEIFQNIWSILTTPNENLTNILMVSPLTFLDAYLGMLLFTTIFDIKSNSTQQIKYVCIFSFIGILSRIFIPNPYGTFVNVIALPILVIFIFKTTVLKGFLAELLPLLITVILESIYFKLFLVIFNASYETMMQTPIYRLTTMSSIYLTIYLIYRLAKYLKVNIAIIDNIDTKTKILLALNLILAIALIASQLYLIAFYNNNLPIFITLLNVFSLLAYFIISMYSIIRTTQLEITTRNLEESQLYNKTLTILHDNIRCFKHDFGNIVQAIGGYVQTEDLAGLKNYYSQLLQDCKKVTNLNVLNPEIINNPAIYSLLTSKYYDADEKGITFNIDVFLDLNKLNMKIYEFSRILGILLDNAIEATSECDEKIINFSLRKEEKNNRQVLLIENTYKNKDIDIEKIYEKSYSTKPNNTGLGLWEVRKILNKNNNLNLFTSKNDKFFKQQLEIYME